jgi:hypothetical protein
MDMSADEAEAELRNSLRVGIDGNHPLTAIELALWLKKWCMTAGYKRLAKIVLEVVK